MDFRFRDLDQISSTTDPDTGLDSALRIAVVFSAIALGAAIFATPLMQRTVDHFAGSGAFGVDRVMTGSITSRPERYTIRKSVLNPGTDRICDKRTMQFCKIR